MIPANIIKEIVKRHFPKSNVEQCRRFPRGYINFVFDVRLKNPDKSVVLKLFKSQLWRAAKEYYIYKLISSKTDVPVPHVYAVDDSKEIFDGAYLIMEQLKGKNLDLVYKDSRYKAKLAGQAGAYLAKMHSIKFKKFGWIKKNKVDAGYKKWYEFIVQDFDKKLRIVSGIVDKNLLAKAKKYFSDNKELLDIKCRPVLLHKDYHFNHINAFGSRITGIYDVEWAIAGHNELDLIKPFFWMFKGFPAMERPFLEGYKRHGSIDRGFSKRKKLYALNVMLGSIAFSLQIKEKRMLKENINGLKNLFES